MDQPEIRRDLPSTVVVTANHTVLCPVQHHLPSQLPTQKPKQTLLPFFQIVQVKIRSDFQRLDQKLPTFQVMYNYVINKTSPSSI